MRLPSLERSQLRALQDKRQIKIISERSGGVVKMIKVLGYAFFVCTIIFGIIGCAPHHQMERGHAGHASQKIKKNVVLNPADSQEECVTLKNGQVLVYQFSSSKPVDFNIHYHTEHEIQYPVDQKEITQYSGTFDPQKKNFNLEREEYFCMMWKNRDMSMLRLSYDCFVEEK